ncbi:carboxypeptidase N subunit 2-like [Mytilus edulis]|uniref:carboxypeptidase N subunit 2-like n=1 Tax=Mytilus edulis TaxID=6550 RepID=UPI0039EE7498
MILTVIVIVIVSLLEHTYAVPCIGFQKFTCDCTGTKVDCSSKGLTAIPEGVPINTTELNLRRNRISIIPANAFEDLVLLKSLNLGSNLLSSLPGGLFSKNINLRTIDLQKNRISIIPVNAFEDLVLLEYLNLGSNLLSSLPGGLFSKNINLRTIDLQKNRISIIPVNAFEDLVLLEYLSLGNNRISTIAAKTFEDLVSLEILQLYSNSISSLPDGLFSNNTNLKIVALGNNRISIIPVNAFEDLVLLEFLYLNANTISSLPDGVFSKNINLRTVNLNVNQLVCCNMTDLLKWTVLQTEIKIYGKCHDFVTVTNIRDFDISNCAIPVDGRWSSWTTTSCSMTCGNGMTYRNRTCDNPSPSDGGNMCQGVDNESTVCNLGDCPVDGHWGLWSSVRCSVTCGNGIGIRTRRCDNPAPSGGGNGCVGCDKKKKLCSLGKCHKS